MPNQKTIVSATTGVLTFFLGVSTLTVGIKKDNPKFEIMAYAFFAVSLIAFIGAAIFHIKNRDENREENCPLKMEDGIDTGDHNLVEKSTPVNGDQQFSMSMFPSQKRERRKIIPAEKLIEPNFSDEEYTVNEDANRGEPVLQ